MSAPASPIPQQEPVFGLRLAVGLLGALLAAMAAGLVNRVPALVMVDVQGGLGISRDSSSWIDTAYLAGELAAMPFAAWLAITFSLRRFHLTMSAAMLALAAITPFIRDLDLLLAVRLIHGWCAGSLIPILMMAALRFLPGPIRLHGLALFAMTATLAPNVALWLAAFSVDGLEDWRWAYWHIIPLGLAAMAMVGWGIPKMPAALPRLKQANWFGMALAVPGLMLLVVGIDQGVRLEWFNSPLIVAALGLGSLFLALFILTELRHPAGFVRLDLLKRRNIWMGFVALMGLLVAMYAGAGLPAATLAGLHGFRPEQTASLGLLIGLPQLVLGSCVALLLYQRWVDARYVFALGLGCIATACWLASGITDAWMVPQLLGITMLHAVGQALGMVGMLFLIVSAVQPAEGPFLAGMVNIVRVISTILSGALLGQLNVVRGRFHYEALRDSTGNVLPQWAGLDPAPAALAGEIARQASVLAVADVYRVIALLLALLIPFVLRMQHTPAPVVPRLPRPAEQAALPA